LQGGAESAARGASTEGSQGALANHLRARDTRAVDEDNRGLLRRRILGWARPSWLNPACNGGVPRPSCRAVICKDRDGRTPNQMVVPT